MSSALSCETITSSRPRRGQGHVCVFAGGGRVLGQPVQASSHAEESTAAGVVGESSSAESAARRLISREVTSLLRGDLEEPVVFGLY